MRYIFNFPDIGEGLEEGTILEWYVVKGQAIKSGQALVNMETDKIVTDIPSPKAGTIVEIYGSVGETIRVGSPLVEIEIEGVSGEEAVAVANEPVKKVIPEEEGAAGVVGTMELAGKSAILSASDEGASKQQAEEKRARKAQDIPLARAMTRDRNVDINTIIGTGPSGRVSKEDVENFKSSKGTPEKVHRTEPVTRILSADAVTYEPLTQI